MTSLETTVMLTIIVLASLAALAIAWSERRKQRLISAGKARAAYYDSDLG